MSRLGIFAGAVKLAGWFGDFHLVKQRVGIRVVDEGWHFVDGEGIFCESFQKCISL